MSNGPIQSGLTTNREVELRKMTYRRKSHLTLINGEDVLYEKLVKSYTELNYPTQS